MEDNIGNGDESLTNEEVGEALLDWHAEGCLWGDMRPDTAASSLSPRTSPHSPCPSPQQERKRKKIVRICDKSGRGYKGNQKEPCAWDECGKAA